MIKVKWKVLRRNKKFTIFASAQEGICESLLGHFGFDSQLASGGWYIHPVHLWPRHHVPCNWEAFLEPLLQPIRRTYEHFQHTARLVRDQNQQDHQDQESIQPSNKQENFQLNSIRMRSNVLNLLVRDGQFLSTVWHTWNLCCRFCLLCGIQRENSWFYLTMQKYINK